MNVKHVKCAVLLSCLSLSPAVFAQNPVGDAVQGVVQGARQGAADAINQSVNEALGVPNNVQQQNWAQDSLRQSVAPNQDGYRIQQNVDPRLRDAGFRPGDVILDRNGQPIQNADGLNQMLNNYDGNVQVRRNGQVLQVGASQQFNNTQSNQRRLGIQMQPSSNAVVVSQIERNSLAARAGLQPGDRILAINGQEVNDPRMVGQRLQSINDSQVVLLVERQGRPMEMVVSFTGNQHVSHGNAHQGNQGDLASRVQELEGRVNELESQLASIQQEHQRVLQEHQQLMQQNNGNNQADNAANQQ